MAEKTISCRGANGSIVLSNDKMLIQSSFLRSTPFHEMPLNSIRAVVVERKSVIPFATLTILGSVVTILAQYNALWFMINLEPSQVYLITRVGFSAVILCVILMTLRLVFVNVSVRSEGDSTVLTVRLVPLRPAKRLVRRFRELSAS